MDQDQLGRNNNSYSVGQMKKELIKYGVVIDKDTNIESAYYKFFAERGDNQQINQSRFPATPSDSKFGYKTPVISQGKLGDRFGYEGINSNFLGGNDRRPQIKNVLNVLDSVKEKKFFNPIGVVEQSNTDQTQMNQNNPAGQIQGNDSMRNSIQSNNRNNNEEGIGQSDSQNSGRQSRVQMFNFGNIGNIGQSQRNSLQVGNRASSASQNSNNRLSNGQNQNNTQRSSLENHNRLSGEQNQNDNQIHQNYKFLNIQSPVGNQPNRSSYNSGIGGYIPNDNSSRRVSNQNFFQSNQQNSTGWKNGEGKRLTGGIPASAEQENFRKQLSIEKPQQMSASNIYQRSATRTDQKYSGNSLMGTARALSQSQRKQLTSQQPLQNESFLNLAKFTLFGDKKLNQEENANMRESQIYYQQQQMKTLLNFKTRLQILISKIDTGHIIMFIIMSLFSIFFLQNIYQYLTYKPDLEYCDSTLRPEEIENRAGLCIPCPQNAVCLNGIVKCKQSYVLVDKKCIINPQIEPNTILYIKTLAENLQFIQAQYYCSDPNSQVFGNSFIKPYKEHKWDQLVNIITTLHGKDMLFYDTLSKVSELLKSKSIRDQFDINYDPSRDTYFVSIFSPSYYCQAKIYVMQNWQYFFGGFCVFAFIFLVYQLKGVRRFIYFTLKAYNEYEKKEQKEKQDYNNDNMIQNQYQNQSQSGTKEQQYYQNQQQLQNYQQQQQQQQYLQQQQQYSNQMQTGFQNNQFQTPQSNEESEQNYQSRQYLQIPSQQQYYNNNQMQQQQQSYRRSRLS